MKHGTTQSFCELHGWQAGRHWHKHAGCEMQIEPGTTLLNPNPKEKLDGIRVLTIVPDTNGNDVFVLEKVFCTPEDEKTAGHHKHQAMTRKHFAAKYGAWSKA